MKNDEAAQALRNALVFLDGVLVKGAQSCIAVVNAVNCVGAALKQIESNDEGGGGERDF